MEIEIRSSDCAVISGYVNAVERRSKVLSRPGAPPFREIVKPGTFRKAIGRGEKIELRFNHGRVICDTGSGLELCEDNVGLRARAIVSDREVVEAAKSGRLTGWSFGFRCLNDSWRTDEDGIELRELNDISLSEVSVLTLNPAYIATSVEVRDNGEAFECRSCGDKPQLKDSYNFSVEKAELTILSLGGRSNE